MTVRSWTMRNSIDAGIDACNSGSTARTRSTVPTIFAPGCRYTCITTALLPFERPAV